MTTRERELIAIGISYAINCDPCINYHWHVGKEAGVTEEEAREAVKIARMVANGASLRMTDVVEELFGNPAESETAPVPDGCGCADTEEKSEEDCGC
jgi:AhpD family alkylhydroperoxidase